jgi:hypothetical protein
MGMRRYRQRPHGCGRPAFQWAWNVSRLSLWFADVIRTPAKPLTGWVPIRTVGHGPVPSPRPARRTRGRRPRSRSSRSASRRSSEHERRQRAVVTTARGGEDAARAGVSSAGQPRTSSSRCRSSRTSSATRIGRRLSSPERSTSSCRCCSSWCSTFARRRACGRRCYAIQECFLNGCFPVDGDAASAVARMGRTHVEAGGRSGLGRRVGSHRRVGIGACRL